MTLNTGGSILDFILYYPYDKFPLLPWEGLSFIGYVIGEIFYDVKYKSKSDLRIKKMKKFIFYILIIGTRFLVSGILLGSNYPVNTPYEGYWYNLALFHINIMNTNQFLIFLNLPYFILKGHFTFMFYSLGIDFIILSLLTYCADFKRVKNTILNCFSFSGKFAFSIFLYHNFWIPLFYRQFDYIWGWPAWIGYAFLVIFLIWISVKKFNGIGTIEWLVVIFTYKQRKKIEFKIKNLNIFQNEFPL